VAGLVAEFARIQMNSAIGPDATDLPRPTACTVCFARPIPAGSRSEADRHVSHGINSNDQGIEGVRDSRKRISTAVALGGAATAPFRRNQVGPPAPVLCVACMTAFGLTTESVRRFRQAVTPWKGAPGGEKVFLCPKPQDQPAAEGVTPPSSTLPATGPDWTSGYRQNTGQNSRSVYKCQAVFLSHRLGGERKFV